MKSLGKETDSNDAWSEKFVLDNIVLVEIPKLKTKIRHILNIMMYGMPILFIVFSTMFFIFGAVLMQK